MHDEEIKAMAVELAVARTGKPSRPGATRKRIMYTPESVGRAVRLFRQSGQSPSVFARRLGVSASALTRWAADSEDGATFIPIRAATKRSFGEAPDFSEVAHVAATPSPKGATVVVRETVVTIPADLDLGRVSEIMVAMRGGVPC